MKKALNGRMMKYLYLTIYFEFRIKQKLGHGLEGDGKPGPGAYDP